MDGDEPRSGLVARVCGAVPQWAVLLAAMLLSWTVIRLTWLFWSDQFTYRLVAEYSHRDAGAYRIAALWASNLGSLLVLTMGCAIVLWLRLARAPGYAADRRDATRGEILGSSRGAFEVDQRYQPGRPTDPPPKIGAAEDPTFVIPMKRVRRRQRGSAQRFDPRPTPSPAAWFGTALVTTVVALLSGAIWAGGDLFARLSMPPLEGAGMPPILEHPAMLVHPPLMLTFMVGCFVCFLRWFVPLGPRGRSDRRASSPERAIVVDGRSAASGADRPDADIPGASDPGANDPGLNDPGLNDPGLNDAIEAPSSDGPTSVGSLGMLWALGTLTMAIGAFWAYGEVGWGGFWAWDAVENTSLMPWLALLIALHMGHRKFRSSPATTSAAGDTVSRLSPTDGAATGGVMTVGYVADASRTALPPDQAGHRRDAARAGLAASSFAFVMIGTAITRTAPVGSVHAFAIAGPDAVIIQWTAVLVALAIAIKLIRSGAIRSRPAPETAVLVAMLAVVLIGTLGPALIAAVSDDSVALRPRFFVLAMYPLALIAVGLQAFVALRNPAIASARTATRLLTYAALGATTGLIYAALSKASLLGIVLAAAGGLAAGLFVGIRPAGVLGWRTAALLGHIGFGVLLIGIGTSTGDQNVHVVLSPGESSATELGTVELVDLSGSPQDVLDAIQRDPVGRPQVVVTATVTVDDETLHPAVREFPLTNVILAEPDGVVGWRRDIWVSLVRVTPSGAAVLGIETQPGMPAIWIGCAILIGAGLSARPIRRRTHPAVYRSHLPHTTDPAGEPRPHDPSATLAQ
ncbi:MAG: cytochrome c biogenesis protein CcsA [Actinobacteria bacterium]|nr:cytochrome c biogenesis protein CcsA [Actinomycetota bacterium]